MVCLNGHVFSLFSPILVNRLFPSLLPSWAGLVGQDEALNNILSGSDAFDRGATQYADAVQLKAYEQEPTVAGDLQKPRAWALLFFWFLVLGLGFLNPRSHFSEGAEFHSC